MSIAWLVFKVDGYCNWYNERFLWIRFRLDYMGKALELGIGHIADGNLGYIAGSWYIGRYTTSLG